MSLDVLQVVALCAHANRFFPTDLEKPFELRRNHPAFKIATEITFERKGNLSRVYQETSLFLKVLKAEGVDMLYPVLEATVPVNGKQPNAAGWGFIADGDRGMELWTPSWRAFMTHGQDASPWHVTYLAERTNRFGAGAIPPFDLVEATFDRAMREGLDFFEISKHPKVDEFLAARAFWIDRQLMTEGFEGFLPEGISHRTASALATSYLIIKTVCSLPWRDAGKEHSGFEDMRSRLWKAATKVCEIACLHVNDSEQSESTTDLSGPSSSQVA